MAPNGDRHMAFKVLAPITLQTAIADDGTLTIAYPTGTTQASFTGRNASADGVVILNDNEVYAEGASTFSLTYGGPNITLTNLSGAAWPVGTVLRIELGQAGGGYVNVVKQPAFADLTGGQSPTEAEFNDLLATLRAAGIIAAS